jgi:hypothetical protein
VAAASRGGPPLSRGQALAPLAALDAQQHALGIDIVRFECHHFGDAQAGSIGRGERGLVLRSCCRLKQQRDLLDAEHRRQPLRLVAQTRVLIARMLDELDAVTTHQGELAEEILAATAADRDPRRRNAMLRAISLSSRAATLKNLAAAAKTVAQIEAPSAGAVGKKAQATAAAWTAGNDSDWGDDLVPAVRIGLS